MPLYPALASFWQIVPSHATRSITILLEIKSEMKAFCYRDPILEWTFISTEDVLLGIESLLSLCGGNVTARAPLWNVLLMRLSQITTNQDVFFPQNVLHMFHPRSIIWIGTPALFHQALQRYRQRCKSTPLHYSTSSATRGPSTTRNRFYHGIRPFLAQPHLSL